MTKLICQIPDFLSQPGQRFTSAGYTGNSLPSQIASRTLLFAMAGAGLYFLYHLVTAGFAYMGSLGDEAKLMQIKKQITNALLGLLTVISAFFLLQIIQTITKANLI